MLCKGCTTSIISPSGTGTPATKRARKHRRLGASERSHRRAPSLINCAPISNLSGRTQKNTLSSLSTTKISFSCLWGADGNEMFRGGRSRAVGLFKRPLRHHVPKCRPWGPICVDKKKAFKLDFPAADHRNTRCCCVRRRASGAMFGTFAIASLTSRGRAIKAQRRWKMSAERNTHFAFLNQCFFLGRGTRTRTIL